MTLRALLAACLATLPMTAAADAVPADGAAFAGSWSVARPEAPGTVVNAPVATCDAPVVIAHEGGNRITYTGRDGVARGFEVMSFDGRFPWWSDAGNVVTAWQAPDRFRMAIVSPMGKTDWAGALDYTRCAD